MTTKPVVLVTWHDAQDLKDTWASEKDTQEWSTTSCVIASVGFLGSRPDR